VAIPTRDWLFCRPVTPDGLPHFHLLKVLAERNYQNEPYPIPDEIYWVRDHKWERFPIELADSEVRRMPPSGFLEAIGELQLGEEWCEQAEITALPPTPFHEVDDVAYFAPGSDTRGWSGFPGGTREDGSLHGKHERLHDLPDSRHHRDSERLVAGLL
jgi:hypothetical protein